ncbi:unnamed protein product [Pylaiella littoralis]
MTSYGEARLQGAPLANMMDDLTTTSGLILAYGLIAMIGGTVDTAGAAFGVDAAPDINGSEGVFPPILLLLANLTVSIFGLLSVILGFQYLVSRWGSKFSALMGLAITLAAWFPFLVTVSFISYQAHFENVYGGAGPLQIPEEASTGVINSVALLGILGFWGYAGTVSALTFLQWKMYRFFAGAASTYSASYYRSRNGYYGFLSLMVGCVQIALGAISLQEFGSGPLAAPVVTGPFFIRYPELSILVGACQIPLGFYIMYRSTTAGVGPSTGNKDSGLFFFQVAAWSVYLISMGAQVYGQVALAASNAPALFIRNVIGFAMFPLYLDVMAHTTPENVTADMFSTSKTLHAGM